MTPSRLSEIEAFCRRYPEVRDWLPKLRRGEIIWDGMLSDAVAIARALESDLAKAEKERDAALDENENLGVANRSLVVSERKARAEAERWKRAWEQKQDKAEEAEALRGEQSRLAEIATVAIKHNHERGHEGPVESCPHSPCHYLRSNKALTAGAAKAVGRTPNTRFPGEDSVGAETDSPAAEPPAKCQFCDKAVPLCSRGYCEVHCLNKEEHGFAPPKPSPAECPSCGKPGEQTEGPPLEYICNTLGCRVWNFGPASQGGK